ncbi:MAG: Na+/H+ antiporter subunit E [Gammaproteobacteria bacterium]|nr:Na+/H+ antiporter subunit E [Gammaproteobacteria bacterium]
MKTTDKQKKHFTDSAGNSLVIRVRTVLFRAVMFALLWWVLVDGASDSWSIGLPVVVLATLVSVLLLAPTSWSLVGCARFIPFFIWQSIRGGIDVASRAMHPQLLITPGLVNYPFRLPQGPTRIFMSNVVNLLPGTLSVELEEENLRIHVLDENGAFAEELKTLENCLAGVFGLVLEEANHGGSEQ